MQQFQSFGTMLYWLRVTYPQRVALAQPGMPIPKKKLTQIELIECLERAGYSLSAATYSELESGSTFPRDAETFLQALSQCLTLTEKELSQLKRQLAYDIIRARLGENFANSLPSLFDLHYKPD